MRRVLAWTLSVGIVWSAAAGAPRASEPPPVSPQVAAQLQALDDTESELADSRARLTTASSWRERRRLHARIKELESQQERLLAEVETALFGPRPAAVRDEPIGSFDQRLDTQRQHRDAILERDDAPRLPSP